ncbi:alpha/beta hydrolase family protein [Marinicella meishanensis]|uniref:alpha/beta hydrolase family protein n=1 Tax=Marinicella meishanensis TaxID=2873263 RepID=UPI001CBE0B4D|nr:prolyl oligopeptidase family serine peptidase [Marinicella sp. NBU2979]
MPNHSQLQRTILTPTLGLLLMLICGTAWGLKFNENELQILKGSDPELAADEGYLYLSVESNHHFTTLIIDPVDSGKKLRFTDLTAGENHALIKLKAGKYYWKSIRGYLLFGLSWFKFEADEHTFEVKPGVVNYPGTWRTEFKYTGLFRGYFSLKSFNKAAIEWPHFQENYRQFTGDTPMVFSGYSADEYHRFFPAMLKKYDFKARQQLDYREIEQSSTPIKLFDIDDGVDQQIQQFPMLNDYLDHDAQVSGEINPSGEWVLMSSKQNKQTLIEVVNIKTFKSYVVFKEFLPNRARVRNLRWIDQNSFLYDLDYEKYSFSQVVHLQWHGDTELTGAQVVEMPLAGSVLDPLIDQENRMLFTNHRLQDVNNKNINGVYLVDTSTEKTVKKSFKKKFKKTKKFDKVIDWLTDHSGAVRSAIEVEYDKKNEQVLYHHWFLPNKDSDDWVKIKTSYDDDDVPLPVKLSADETFFYAFTDAYGDKQSVHKYSVTDYAHLGPFIENPEVDIETLIQDPSTRQIIGYTHMEGGLSQRLFLDEESDRIKSLREQNPQLQLYVQQHLPEHGLMLLYATTQFSKGSWYLYQQQAGSITKLLDESPVYEQLPKGDNHSLTITAEDGVTVEGFLVVPSLRGDNKPPLVVIPHGGPIGVRDTANNDEMQHFFAAKGIATLKVNYRGSSGYGKAFKELGKQQWGEKIEADIHAMVLHAAEKHDLDLHKVCAMGSSYGGYSAVMLTVLYPEVYRCAISLHGVMDLPLLFGNESLIKDDGFFTELAQIVGDPQKDLNRLLNKSPFYLVEKINRPIKLFHGLTDERVTLEHALRMQQMFTILKMDADLTILMDEGHSMKHLNSNIHYVAESLKFLDQHLDLPLDIGQDTKDLPPATTVTDYINADQ